MIDRQAESSHGTNDQSQTELAKEIRASAESNQPVETNLSTSQRIIDRVTDGIYREPWAAFRELVSNAYDADATHVVIETGAPDFEQMTVRDDGNGMTPTTLAYVVKNIGGSSKRTATGIELNTSGVGFVDRSPGGRPLIGKIGIGMFAVAQLTQHFQIITKAAGEPIRTSATVRLKTYDDSQRESNDENYVAGTVSIISEKTPESEVDAHGTAIVLYSLRPAIRELLQSTERWKAAQDTNATFDGRIEPPIHHMGVSIDLAGDRLDALPPNLPWSTSDHPIEKFQGLINAAANLSGKVNRSADLGYFDEYLRLIWKLSLSLPLNYINQHPFDLDQKSGISFFDLPQDGKTYEVNLGPDESLRNKFNFLALDNTQRNRFTVTLDGVELRRPIQLPHTLVAQRSINRIKCPVLMVSKQDNPFPDDTLSSAGGRLSFEAYLYWNNKIVPKDNAGVLIRVRDASGTLFDPTFLNYQVSEQTRLRQITAEIFVHEGLDGAINIDREAFNYSHPHFLYIQQWLHRALRLLVNKLKGIANEDLKRERARQRVVAREGLRKYAEEVWEARIGEESDPPLSEPFMGNVPSEVGGVEIDWDASETNKDEAWVSKAEAVAVILEAYGVLSNLSPIDRKNIIRDILGLLETDS